MATSAIDELVRATAWIDTHEHLLEEHERLGGPTAQDPVFSCEDWAYLFSHYAADDLVSAGMPRDDLARFLSPELSPTEKWDLVEPHWQRCNVTGYLRSVEISVRMLFDLDITRDSCDEITRRMRDLAQPGFYRRVLNEDAGVASCHVNSLRSMFCETAQPDLLLQDLSILPLTRPSKDGIAEMEQVAGETVHSFNDFMRVVDGCFGRYGRQAVAVKSQWAYFRPLAVGPGDRGAASSAFDRQLRGEALSRHEEAALQDYLFDHCVRRATDFALPVKLHTGYYFSTCTMPLRRVRDNLSDMCELLARYPGTTFVVMHGGYPYQHEAIAVAKQYPNCVIDLCWDWIIDPVSTEDLLRRFLVTAPHSKVLCFGGDYFPVELVVGHAEIARRGLVRALTGLVDVGHLSTEEALRLVPELMHGNARRTFPRVGALDAT